MHLLKRWAMPAMMAMAVAAMPARAEAANLTFLQDFGNNGTIDATYSLTVQEGCTNDCTVDLVITYSATSAFIGTYLDSVQFTVDGTTASDLKEVALPGAETDWNTLLANLTANQCSGGSTQSVCSEFTANAIGYPPGGITGGLVLTFSYTVDWSTALSLPLNGNVRAAYNNSDGSNFAIFSPGGGGFGGGGGTGGGGIVVPEPAALLLFGMAAFGGAYRARRRRTA